MDKRFLKILSVPAISLLLFSCANGTPTKKYDPVPNSAFWTLSAGEKVLRDRSRENYSLFEQDPQINVKACRGEWEMAQLIVTPNRDVDRYYATVSSLKSADGFSIPKKNVEVYGAKYVNVKTIYDTATGAPTGRYPDALVPIDALRKFDDAKIKNGENQAIYLAIEIPLNQKPGIYTGTIEVSLDTSIHQFPITVEVYSLQVSNESHSKTCFGNDWMFESGELDATEDMLNAYNKASYKYRINGRLLSFPDHNSDKDINDYTEKAFIEMQNPRCTNVSLPTKDITVDNYGGASFDEEVMKKYINSYFNKSIKENFNMFEKTTIFMGGIIDEPDDRAAKEPHIPWRTRYVCSRFKAVIEEMVEKLSQINRNHPLHSEIIESLKHLPNIVTASYADEYVGYIDTWCPKASFYNTPEQRANYDDVYHKWWYTCIFPKAPFPTYHTEDKLSSARLLSWMQSNYDVVGNLFWATNLYCSANNGVYGHIEDYYEGDADRYSGCNGDGYLWYPAAQYELDEPAPSLRLTAIRDGLEEYEILYEIKENMKRLGLDKEALFNFLTEYLYDGTVVNGTSLEVEQARDDLIKLATLNGNGSDFTITDYNYDKENNKVSLGFYANEGTTIKLEGVELTDRTVYKNGFIYKGEYTLSGNKNTLDIEVTYNNETITINHAFGNENVIYRANDIKNDFSKYNSSVTTTVVDYEEYEDVLKLEVGKPKDKKQSIKFKPSFIKDINDTTYKLTFNVINPTDEEMLFSIGNRFSSKNYDQYFVENQALRPGYNTVEINLSYTNWNSVGSLDYLMFVFGDNTSLTEEAKEFYIANIILTSKQGEK